MFIAMLLGLSALATPADDVLSSLLLGAYPEAISTQFPACSASNQEAVEAGRGVVRQQVLTCRFAVLGQPADVTFGFNALMRVSNYTIMFPGQLSRENVISLYNGICQQLRGSFPQYSEQRNAQAVRRAFVAPYRAIAYADIQPDAASGAQISVVIDAIPIAQAATGASSVTLDSLDIAKDLPALSR